MKKIFLSILFLLLLFQFYAQPGKDGTLTVSASTQIVNQYSPVASSITIGDNTLSIASTSIISLCIGDLIMVYQAQGATLSFSNSALYGDITAYNSAGLYEFKYVQSVSGNIITTQTTFTNAYASTGRTQVIKVPQYTTLTINPGSSIIPKPWKDTTISAVAYRFGGLVVLHASNIVNNGIIKADGAGFRGGAIQTNSTAPWAGTAFLTTLISDGGEKGESIFGYQVDYDLNGGRYGRGAPANGGGGGAAHNAGGGGGGNGWFNGNAWTGAGVMIVDPSNLLAAWSLDPDFILNGNSLTNSSGGGRGGYSYGSMNGNANINAPGNVAWGLDYRRNVGGLGGRPLNNINAETRIYFGGGGGTANQNDASSPPAGNGGGIVYLIATTWISGTGTISANGNTAGNTFSCNCDGAPGAGAGGSIVIKTAAVGAQAISAVGGVGGSQMSPFISVNPFENEGPGGGGGGGFAAISVPVPLNVSGGNNGVSLSTGVTEMPFNGATKGASGHTATLSVSFATFVPITYTISSNSPVCSGATINFTSTAATNYTWSGPNGFSSSLQNPTVPNASTLMAGTYSFANTNTGTCSFSSSQTIAVVVNPTPTLSAANEIICPTTTGTLSASGAASYTWNPGGIVSNSLTASPIVTTVYTVTGMSASGCTATLIRTITVRPTLTLNITASSPTTCVGSVITLTALNSGGTPAYSYTWTAGPLTSVYNTSQPAGSYVYTVTSKDLNNCLASKTISLNFIAPPVLSVSSISICPGTIGTLTASGASSYTWNPGNIVVNPLVAGPLVNSNYTVTGSAAGCTANANASITLKPLPSLSFLTASITCASLGSATVNASGGALGPYSYSWTPSAQTSSIANNLNPGVYTLSVLDSGSGCTSVSTTTFTSLVPFAGLVSASSSVSCSGMSTGTAAIVLSGGSGSQSYTWTNPAGTQTTSAAVNLSAAIHTVIVIDNLTFCNVTHTFLVTQPQPFLVSILPSANMACVNTTIVLAATASGGTPPYNYTWTPTGVVNFFNPVSQNAGGSYPYLVNAIDGNNCPGASSITLVFVDTPTLTPQSTTVCEGAMTTLSVSGALAYSWYPGGFTGSSISFPAQSNMTYTILGSSFGCTNTINASVFVNSITPPTILASNNVCQGLPINLGTTASGNYQWVGPNGFNSISQTTVISSASFSNAGVYSLTLTDGNGCSAATSTMVNILANPVISANGASVCIGEPATLAASGGMSYLWTGPNSYTSSLANPIVPVVDNNSAGPYTILITGLNGCPTKTIVQLVGYDFPLPTPSITSNSKICLNGKITLQGSGGSFYLWHGPGGLTSQDQNLDFTAVSVNMTGIYTLSVKNTSNCVSSATVLVNVFPLPKATLKANRDLTCVPLCADFSLVQAANIAPIVKSTLSVENLFSSDSIFRYCIQVPGTHLVNAFFTDTNGCVGTSSLNLSVYPHPSAGFEFYPQNPVENIDQVFFTNTSQGDFLKKWNWFFMDNSSEKSQLKDPSFFFPKAGSFPVAMIVKNIWGCSDTIVKSIVVAENFEIYVPNAFTPNSDGKNDTFQPKGTGVATYHIQLYNRWGEKLYESTDFFKGWDGNYKGKPCTDDVYLWKIQISSLNGKIKNLEGYVTLVE